MKFGQSGASLRQISIGRALAAAGILFTAVFTSPVFADGGVVLAQKISGPYQITLFGSPSPLRAGPADLSVFVQDLKTGNAVLDSNIQIQIQAKTEGGGEAWVPPCCSMMKSASTMTATHDAAQNRLLYAANTIISASGTHQISVRLNDEDVLSTPVEISPALPPLTHYWAFLAFPPLAIVGFTLNQRLRRRR